MPSTGMRGHARAGVAVVLFTMALAISLRIPSATAAPPALTGSPTLSIEPDSVRQGARITGTYEFTPTAGAASVPSSVEVRMVTVVSASGSGSTISLGLLPYQTQSAGRAVYRGELTIPGFDHPGPARHRGGKRCCTCNGASGQRPDLIGRTAAITRGGEFDDSPACIDRNRRRGPARDRCRACFGRGDRAGPCPPNSCPTRLRTDASANHGICIEARTCA